MRIFAFDPGKNNFAYAVIEKQRCVRHGHLRTITEMNHANVTGQLKGFRHDFMKVLGKGSPHDWIAFERMQHRPNLGGGAVVEYINLMIGVCMALGHEAGARIYPVTPVVWKNHFIKRLGVDRKRFTMVGQKLVMKQPPGSKPKTRREFVPGVLDGQPRTHEMSPHEGDAVGIGCYVWEQLTGINIVGHVLT